MMLNKIFPKPDERVLFLGATGSGKTQAAIFFLKKLVGKIQIDILDTKGEPAFLKLPDAEIITSYKDVDKSDAAVRIYQPTGEELSNPNILDEYLQHRYENFPSITYIDELLSLGTQTKPKPGFLNLLTRGRSRNAALWMASQRPAWISLFPFSESSKFFVFYLNNEDDRKKVSKFTTNQLLIPPKEKYGFWFYQVGNKKALEFKPIKIKGEI